MSEVLPAGWIASNLEQLAKSSGGGTPSKADAAFWDEGSIPWVSPKDMKTFVISASEDQVTERALEQLTIIPRESVLIVVRSGILSRTLPVALTSTAVTVNQDLRAFTPKTGVSAKFLAWQLVAMEQRVLAQCSKHGTTVASIEGPALSRFPISLAPSTEQSRIVSKLEELLSDLDAGVAELKAAQRKLALYRQSLLKAAVEGALTADWRARNPPTETGAQLLERILQQRRARWEARQLAKFKEQGKAPSKNWHFKYPEPAAADTAGLPALPSGWAWASIEQLGEVQLGRQRSPDKLKGESPKRYIRAANITEAGIDLTDVLEMDFSESEQKTFTLLPGDVILTEASGSPAHVGRPAIWRGSKLDYCFQNTVLRFTPCGIGSEFAFYSFLAMQKLGVFRAIAGGVGINHLSAGKFSKLLVPLPPEAEQVVLVDAIATKLSLCDDQNALISHSLKQSAAQRKNILQAAFSGQLVPQDPSDEPASVLLARIRAERAARAGNDSKTPKSATRGRRKAAPSA